MKSVEKVKDKKTLREQLEDYRPRMEKMFWVCLGIIMLYDRLGTTPFFSMLRYYFGVALSEVPEDLADLLFNNFFNLRYMILLPAVYTVIMDVRGWKMKLLTVLLLAFGAYYAYYWKKQNDTLIFEIMILIVASYGKEFKKIVYLGIGITAGVLIFAFVMSCFGVLPDYHDIREVQIRHSFGTYHCTDLAAHFCFAVLLYMFIKNGRMKIAGYLATVAVIVFNVIFLGGRNSLICTVLAMFGCIVASVYSKKNRSVSPKLRWPGSVIFISSFIVFAAVYMVLNFNYTDDSQALYHSFGPLVRLGDRLRVSANVTRVLPFSWFGKYFIQIGTGFGNMAEQVGFYTFLDDSYVRVYVMYGVVAFVFFLLLLTGIQIRLLKKGTMFQMFIIFVVALHAILEHRLLDPAYNLFLLLPFTILPETSKDIDSPKTAEQVYY